MPYSTIDREKKILELLQKQGSASIQELAKVFDVSNMTIHRDLNRLVEAGQIHKKHGGVTLAGKTASIGEVLCTMCNKPTSERTVFILQLTTGEKKPACCAHCGLMIQSQSNTIWQSLTVDYLHGYMVSANQAVYVVGSELNVCCVPSILSFGSLQEAEKFQKGFGGSLMNMEQAIQYLHGMMHAHSQAHDSEIS